MTQKVFFAGYSLDTGYVTKINLKTRKTPHMSQREPSQNPCVCTTAFSTKARTSPRSRALQHSRHTIDLSGRNHFKNHYSALCWLIFKKKLILKYVFRKPIISTKTSSSICKVCMFRWMSCDWKVQRDVKLCYKSIFQWNNIYSCPWFGS